MEVSQEPPGAVERISTTTDLLIGAGIGLAIGVLALALIFVAQALLISPVLQRNAARRYVSDLELLLKPDLDFTVRIPSAPRHAGVPKQGISTLSQPGVEIENFWIDNHGKEGVILEFCLSLRAASLRGSPFTQRWRFGSHPFQAMLASGWLKQGQWISNPLHVGPHPWNLNRSLFFAFDSSPFASGQPPLLPDDAMDRFILAIRDTRSGKIFFVREVGEHRLRHA